MPSIPLTQNDIIFALVGAAVIFIIFKVLSTAIRVFIHRAFERNFDPDQIETVLENCYRSFPIDNFDFKGATFHRGASVRITTSRKKIIEGQFIGANQSDLVCLVTDNSVIAQEIGAIMEMQAL